MRGWKRVAAVLAAVLVVTLAGVRPSEAIVAGTFDGDGHPNVAYFEAYDSDGEYLFACSGTLISPTVIVTAAHCSGGDPGLGSIASMKATLDPIPSQATPLAVASWHPHPDYALPVKTGTSQFLAEQDDDIGVIILAAPVLDVAPAAIVGPNHLNALGKRTSLTVVGYGLDREFDPPQNLTFVDNRVRMTTTAGLKSKSPTLLILNGNPKDNHDGGGLCFGDSGGPVFWGSALAAVNSFAQVNCQHTSGHVRLDAPIARNFLDDFVTLPT